MRDPHAPRGRADLRLERAARRGMKLQGRVPVHTEQRDDEPERERLPRVVVSPPRAGHVHAVTKIDIDELLLRLGPTFFYGLRSIELVRNEGDDLAFGRFVAVGTVRLFDVSAPPWRVRLRHEDADRLTRAGAVVSSLPAAHVVDWPGDSLRAFLLFDVLLHELGHHVLQHHHGKRPARIARTRAHEAFADLFALRARRALGRAV